MNNEETIVMKPQNNKAEQPQSVETVDKKSNKGKKVVSTAAASIVGGVVVGGAAYTTTEMLHSKEEAEEQKPEEEAVAAEKPAAAVVDEPQKEQSDEPPKEQSDEPQKEEIVSRVDGEEGGEHDYTNHNGADPVTQNPEVQATVDDTSGGNAHEVQVLGMYEAQGEDGQPMQAAMLTNGHEVAAVVDLDGDGVADVLAVDENQNQQIDEGEVYDLSNDNVHMADYQDLYMAQQQQMQMDQEQNTFAYNASDDQPDYNNDADLSYV